MQNNEYIYVWVRKNLSPEQIVVQSGHACLESGIYFGKKTAEPYTFAVLEVPEENDLKDVMALLDKNNISYRAFIEPDQDYTFTAIATEPIKPHQRKLFLDYPRLKFGKKKC